jgi:antitoxin HicB
MKVVVPSLPGCFTQGETVEEAIEMAKEAICLHVEDLEIDAKVIPIDGRSLEYSLTFTS